MLLFVLTTASATPLVVMDEERVSGLEQTADRLWPDHDLTVQVEPTAELPRFEVRDDQLFWVTESGVSARQAQTDTTIVLLARTWSLTAPEPELGWVPPMAIPEGPELDPLQDLDPDDGRRPLLDGGWFGFGGRMGLPDLAAIPGLGTQFAGQRGPVFLQLHTASRLRSPATAVYHPVNDPIQHEARFGVGGAIGISPPLLPNPDLQLIPFAQVGTELQLYATTRGIAGWPAEIESSKWDFGGQVGSGLEVRRKAIGLRGTGVVDIRNRAPWVSVYGLLAVVIHP